MAGELVPLVLLPRYTSFVGDTTFYTIAMDVSEFTKGIVNAWRGPLLGTAPTYGLSFEESTDQVTWTTCTSGSGGDPGANSETQYTPELKKRWFRAKLVLTGAGASVSTWAVGFLEMRER